MELIVSLNVTAALLPSFCLINEAEAAAELLGGGMSALIEMQYLHDR